jgi:hypothetical protein
MLMHVYPPHETEFFMILIFVEMAIEHFIMTSNIELYQNPSSGS